MRKILLAIFMPFFLAGCATPVSHTLVNMQIYDKDTQYGIEDRPNGFSITVYYSRYQFIPESESVSTACKSQLTAIAWEYAENKGREILPLNEQRIRLSMGRNGLSGITSCQATGIAEWIK